MMARIRSHASLWLSLVVLVTGVLASAVPGRASQTATPRGLHPTFTKAAAFDVSPPMRVLARQAPARVAPFRLPPERGPIVRSHGFAGDGSVQSAAGRIDMPAPTVNFEGLQNSDNPFPVAPPDPDGDVGPNHYVEEINVVWAVYSKTGTLLLGPMDLGSIWAGFGIPDCTDLGGDPIVLYDQLADRWLLSQLTFRGPSFYECVAVSTTPDPTGSYYRYAFSTGENFPDYPKLGVWPNAYFLSTREFAPDDSFAGDGLYALERNRMLMGDPGARAVGFLLPPGTKPWLPGDGLLPSDLDGNRLPPKGSPNYFVGTQDDQGPYGAPFDAINVFQFWVSWGAHPTAAFFQSAQLRVAPFDSAFPCGPKNSRACIHQPGTGWRIDILSYRQRPTWRLAYRNFGSHEALVTNQSVEARPGVAGVRWYEIRRPGDHPFLYQQGTYAPDDGTNRWMGSIAMDKQGNAALGYSVSSKQVYPGIRYTGRLRGDPVGTMPQGEAVLINGGGAQTGTHRWGDYTSMNVDPTDDCTFWYVNEYYRHTSPFHWRTRVGSFRFPGCT
jgi:hypothetical protein